MKWLLEKVEDLKRIIENIDGIYLEKRDLVVVLVWCTFVLYSIFFLFFNQLTFRAQIKDLRKELLLTTENINEIGAKKLKTKYDLAVEKLKKEKGFATDKEAYELQKLYFKTYPQEDLWICPLMGKVGTQGIWVRIKITAHLENFGEVYSGGR